MSDQAHPALSPEVDDEFLSAKFTVTALEAVNDEPAEYLVHDIKGEILGPDNEDENSEGIVIGYINAQLVNVMGLLNSNVNIFECYDMRSQHLAEAYEVVFDDAEYEYRSSIVAKVGFYDPSLVEWHLHASGLYLEPAHRGSRRGVRALGLLRQYAQRPGLFVSARAFPETPAGKPTAAEIKRLTAYYLSHTPLGFHHLGSPRLGWIVANWSC